MTAREKFEDWKKLRDEVFQEIATVSADKAFMATPEGDAWLAGMEPLVDDLIATGTQLKADAQAEAQAPAAPKTLQPEYNYLLRWTEVGMFPSLPEGTQIDTLQGVKKLAETLALQADEGLTYSKTSFHTWLKGTEKPQDYEGTFRWDLQRRDAAGIDPLRPRDGWAAPVPAEELAVPMTKRDRALIKALRKDMGLDETPKVAAVKKPVRATLKKEERAPAHAGKVAATELRILLKSISEAEDTALTTIPLDPEDEREIRRLATNARECFTHDDMFRPRPEAMRSCVRFLRKAYDLCELPALEEAETNPFEDAFRKAEDFYRAESIPSPHESYPPAIQAPEKLKDIARAAAAVVPEYAGVKWEQEWAHPPKGRFVFEGNPPLVITYADEGPEYDKGSRAWIYRQGAPGLSSSADLLTGVVEDFLNEEAPLDEWDELPKEVRDELAGGYEPDKDKVKALIAFGDERAKGPESREGPPSKIEASHIAEEMAAKGRAMGLDWTGTALAVFDWAARRKQKPWLIRPFDVLYAAEMQWDRLDEAEEEFGPVTRTFTVSAPADGVLVDLMVSHKTDEEDTEGSAAERLDRGDFRYTGLKMDARELRHALEGLLNTLGADEKVTKLGWYVDNGTDVARATVFVGRKGGHGYGVQDAGLIARVGMLIEGLGYKKVKDRGAATATDPIDLVREELAKLRADGVKDISVSTLMDSTGLDRIDVNNALLDLKIPFTGANGDAFLSLDDSRWPFGMFDYYRATHNLSDQATQILHASVRYDGNVMGQHEFIEKLVGDGYTPRYDKGGRGIIHGPRGGTQMKPYQMVKDASSFESKGPLNKYATWLIEKLVEGVEEAEVAPAVTVQTLKPDGDYGPDRTYRLPPRAALIAAREQDKGNHNTWDYPADDPAIYQKGNRLYLEAPNGTVFGVTVPGGEEGAEALFQTRSPTATTPLSGNHAKKWQMIQQGYAVVLDDIGLDALGEHYDIADVVSLPNPDQIGTRDQYIVWDKSKRSDLNPASTRAQLLAALKSTGPAGVTFEDQVAALEALEEVAKAYLAGAGERKWEMWKRAWEAYDAGVPVARIVQVTGSTEDVVEMRLDEIRPGGRMDNAKQTPSPFARFQDDDDDDDVDPNELAMGIKVEKEHTADPAIAEKIARDHLAEFPDYYTRLTKMEAEAKAIDPHAGHFYRDDKGDVYGDSNLLRRMGDYPGASLKHMGFGEFYVTTPDGRIDFHRRDGRDRPGAFSGRIHQVTDNKEGALVAQVLDWLLDEGKAVKLTTGMEDPPRPFDEAGTDVEQAAYQRFRPAPGLARDEYDALVAAAIRIASDRDAFDSYNARKGYAALLALVNGTPKATQAALARLAFSIEPRLAQHHDTHADLGLANALEVPARPFDVEAEDAAIAAWALSSYPERGDAAFMVHAPPVGGGIAGEFWEGLRAHFTARPFVNAIQQVIADSKGEYAISIESQEEGQKLYNDHAEDFLREMYRTHNHGAIPFGGAYDEMSAGAVEAWVHKVTSTPSVAPPAPPVPPTPPAPPAPTGARIKGVAIDPDVMDVLSRGRTKDDVFYLPEGQLDRQLYVKVDKVLKALGGKWNRQIKGHKVPAGFAADLDTALQRGQAVDVKKTLGYFPTPSSVALRAAQELGARQDHLILEPSAGGGALVDAVLAEGQAEEDHFTLVEVDPDRVRELRRRYPRATLAGPIDFLKQTPRTLLGMFDRVIMNPPYDRILWRKHLLHAWNFVLPGGRLVAILPAGAKHDTVLQDKLADHVVEIQDLPAGSFQQAGTMVNTVLFIADKLEVPGEDAEVEEHEEDEPTGEEAEDEEARAVARAQAVLDAADLYRYYLTDRRKGDRPRAREDVIGSIVLRLEPQGYAKVISTWYSDTQGRDLKVYGPTQKALDLLQEAGLKTDIEQIDVLYAKEEKGQDTADRRRFLEESLFRKTYDLRTPIEQAALERASVALAKTVRGHKAGRTLLLELYEEAFPEGWAEDAWAQPKSYYGGETDAPWKAIKYLEKRRLVETGVGYDQAWTDVKLTDLGVKVAQRIAAKGPAREAAG